MYNNLPLMSQLLGQQKVVPVVVIDDEAAALSLAQALLDGGINVIEITLRNAYGLEAIKLIKRTFPEMVVLAGTVTSAQAVHDVVEAGVDGIISPGVTPAILQAASTSGVPILPGVATPSEVLLAMEYGLQECKLFPASIVGGVGAIKAFSGPFPGIRFCPTGGVSAANYKDYLELDNVMCVGGSWIAPSSLIRQGKWQEITANCLDVTNND